MEDVSSEPLAASSSAQDGGHVGTPNLSAQDGGHIGTPDLSAQDGDHIGTPHLSAQDGSVVVAPHISQCDVKGNLTITTHHHHCSGPVNSAATPTQKADKCPTMSDLKEWICSQYETVQEYNSLPEDEVLLADRYTQLLIIEKHGEQGEREKEIVNHGAGFFGARSSGYKSITIDQFFRPNDSGRIPKAVILQGNSGHGKSFTTQRIMLDWASGNLYQDEFDLILHLSCKELNLYSEGSQSVVDLLSCSDTFTPLVLNILKDSPQKVLLLIDGFDELQFPLHEIRKSPVPDFSTPARVEVILCALLNGSILSHCFLLVTTRPTASDKLSKLLKRPVRCTEILGFSEEGVHEYIKRFCKHEEVGKEAFRRVKANETLYTSCFIPVICWIVCTVFSKHLVKNKQQTNSLETTTSIFVHFVSILQEHHCRGLRQPVPDLLRSLGQLAEKGIQDQQVLFDKESVQDTVSEPTSVPFLCKFLMKETVGTKEMFSFMHLSFQEFFTALHYTLAPDEERVKELLKPIEQEEGRTHLLPVIQFLFGLSEEKVMQDLKKLGLSHCMEAQLKKWIIRLIEDSNVHKKKDMMLFTLHCLYELHEEEFVKRAMAVWGEVKFDRIPLTRTDCWVLLYCLQCCPTIPNLELKETSLMLTGCNITTDKLRMLQPELRRCQKLGLHVVELSDDDVDDLISALGEEKTISELCVLDSSLSEESVQQIFTALSKQESVGGVLLSVKTITLQTSETLLHFINSTQTTDWVGVQLPEGADGAESLCSYLIVTREEEHLRLYIGNYGDTSPESETSGLGLVVKLPEISHILLEEITCRFHQLRPLAEKSPEHVDGLMAYMSSLPDLKWVWLGAGCLTEFWAKKILSLIQTCPHLDGVEFRAAIVGPKGVGEFGLLLEEGIHLLQEAQLPPGRTITLTGLGCSKTKDPCRRLRDRKLSCNKEVEIVEERPSEENMVIPSVKKKKSPLLRTNVCTSM
ncbi:NACHT, LRR and PYD domains-containing protein 1 homolog [Engraulis encrasicolus]|uniref:NACHT, LRR and PYD domains-containing protein 1 homolog n=1 Tax=Engraulis encrasicolus TaxID=184585 RepID=UPI002FD57780